MHHEAAAVRPTVRVLLVDDEQRLLLFRGHDAGSGESWWFCAGGGVEAGETAEQAAVREVAEETGYRATVLSGPVWHRRHVLEWDGVLTDLREVFFLARVPAFEVDTAGWTDSERLAAFEHRWWGLAEMRALDADRAAGRTRDRLVPLDLADRLEALLRDGPGAGPVQVGL